MLFNSYVFIALFLPVALAGFFASAKFGRRPAGAWLVLASLVFYSWWNPAFLPLLLASILMNYGMSEIVARCDARPKLQSALLTTAVGLNISALFYFKYYFEVARFMSERLGLEVHADPIILPLGISFFTFTQIGYLIDVKQGVAKDRGFLNYVLFVTFFPHLIAGPILHHREMMPQFAEKTTYRFSLANFTIGTTVFALGLFKKTVLADPLGHAVAAGFASPEGLSFFAAWWTAIKYSLQLYFDFSGYSDMAIGLAFMFNVRFPLNFNSPFKSQNIIEYWQRWHMTLTRYLNLYLYNPLALAVVRWRSEHGYGTKRADQKTLGGFLSMTALPTMLTMGLIGLWHGAGLQFLLFGLLHGFYLTINNAMRTFRGNAKQASTGASAAAHKVFNIAATYIAVVVGLVLFRAASLDKAVSMYQGMSGLRGFAASVSLTEIAWILVLAVLVWGCPNVQQIMGKFAPALGKVEASTARMPLLWQANLRWAGTVGLLLAASLMAMGGTSEFMYFQF
jgi:D-alanyl-lipoteichoic acid acyltransferase DltB (MBOAT superfamily)